MHELSLQYIKRLQMGIDFNNRSLPMVDLPLGFWYAPWSSQLLEAHADIQYRGFCNDIDAKLFPTFRQYDSCLRLMQSVTGNSTFMPEATLLIAHGESCELVEYIAAVQGVRYSSETGAIQNIAVLPEYRNRGIGRGLLLGSLWGFKRMGIKNVTLEVTADNFNATRLYRRIGFSTIKIYYREIGS
ncbi:MAG: GNAT family N-acetyltransferase [Planctomycetaceae bacterium]|jgi:ribosomal protein S18 acetylase RimI-like enzyme|nr:GNAT family N-acetyltransferase [Planctomycetaceae bacterium]